MISTSVLPLPLAPDYPQEVRKQWERFVSGALIEGEKIRPLVSASWKRCQEAGLDPLQLPCAQPVSEEAWESLRDGDLLYPHGTAVVEDLLSTVLLPPHSLVVLANHQSQAVHITGDPHAVTTVAAANVVPGSLVGESTIGTNVVSLASQTGQPAITYRAEHYYESLQPWQSSAVPIQHPQTGRLAGVITLCSLDHYEWQAAFRFLFQAAQMLSLLIENEEKSRRCLLLEQHQARQMHYANDAILTIDREGFIQALSPALAHLTRSLPSHTIPGTPLSAVGLEIRELTGSAHSHTPAEVEIRFRKQEQVHRATVIPVQDPQRAKPIGYVLTLPLPKLARPQPRAATPALRTHSDLRGHTFDTLRGKAPRFLHVVELARRAAQYDDVVLLTGESGTGKELLAHAIHQASARSQGPFVVVNCGGASEELVAAELFGYTAGAFTGALREGKRGKFELAHTGTLFLDEVGNMPMKMQQALLRAIDEQTITPLGAERSRPVDVRIIAATNANLTDRVRDGAFRLDLFHRLNVLPLALPPLRERKEDIPLFIEHVLSDCERRLVIAPETRDCLRAYPWPGNIRELRNLVVRWVRFTTHEVITPADLPPEMQWRETCGENLRGVKQEREKEAIIAALQKTGGSVAQAALSMGVSRVTLYRKIKQYQITLHH